MAGIKTPPRIPVYIEYWDTGWVGYVDEERDNPLFEIGDYPTLLVDVAQHCFVEN